MFSKNGGNLGEPGSVSGMFERKSQIVVEKEKADEDTLMTLVLEAGAEDLKDSDDSWEVITDPANHEAVLAAIQKAGLETASVEAMAMLPKNLVHLQGRNAQGMIRLSDVLEEHDDVQNVYSNVDIDEDELEG
jgi:transcriptional/translational regulatory protein YebC/TACO1